MPIKLITGTPGAGKTLLALEDTLKEAGVKDRSSLKAIIAQLHEEHANSKVTRNVVVCGVEGLKADLFTEMENPLDWQEYEDGTLFLIDEAWKWFGVQCKDVMKDPRFLALAEHRHRGMDFIMTAQMPVQLLAHLRGLVSPHVHVTRKFGTKTTVTYEWPSIQSNPNSQTSKSIAIEKLWSQPPPIYEVYQSATLHTIKRRIPLKVLMIPVIALCVIGLVAAAGFTGKKFMDKPLPGAASDPSLADGVAGSRKAVVVTAEDYLRIRQPRIALVPASAPIFDGREVAAYPRAFCMSSGPPEAVTCRCVTEQNTRLEIESPMCLDMARWGGPYDEYRKASQERSSSIAREKGAGQSPAETARNAGAPLATGVGEPGMTQARYGQMRTDPIPAEPAFGGGG